MIDYPFDDHILACLLAETKTLCSQLHEIAYSVELLDALMSRAAREDTVEWIPEGHKELEMELDSILDTLSEGVIGRLVNVLYNNKVQHQL